MAVEIRQAVTATDLDAALRLRHEVFVGEGILDHPHPDGRLLDVFDALGETVTFVAEAGGRVVGSMRGTRWSAVGFPADAFFDFRPHLPADARTACSLGMFCVEPCHRGVRMGMALVKMLYYWALANGCTHVMGPVRPEAAPLFERTGGHIVGEPFDHPVERVPVVPMVRELQCDEDAFIGLVVRGGAHGLVENFVRRLHDPGELVVEAGQAGDEAFLLVDGAAEVWRDGVRLGALQPGEVFGEMSLLMGVPRTADVVVTEPTELMALDRVAFEDQIVANPDQARRLLRALSHRLAALPKQVSDVRGDAEELSW